jgi:pimeloyl-ACP methyl ester carboxylesterase
VSETIKHDIAIDVSDVVDLRGPLNTAVTVHHPPAGRSLAWPPVVAFGFPGGGYSRRYWDIDEPGHIGYSQAEFHTARGWVFVACDHLGVGDSSVPDLDALTFENLAAANDATTRGVLDVLLAGDLDDRLPALGGRPYLIGMGQSMGGGFLVIQQGLRATFDAVAILGYSAIHTVIPALDEEPTGLHDTERGTSSVTMADYVASARPGLFRVFHWDDVPADLVDADLAHIPRIPEAVPSWGSLTTPNVAFTMTSEGCVAKEAALIECPVFVGAGERDVVPDFHAEPSAYVASRDVTTFQVPRMAHMHNFAGSRELMWQRVHAWGSGLSSTSAAWR